MSNFECVPFPKTSNTHRRTLSNIAISPGTSRNSNHWTDDYFHTDNGIVAFEKEGNIALPPVAATTSRPFPRSIPISPEEDSYPPRQTRTHQRSLTALLPFRVPKSRENSKSPERNRPGKERSQDVDEEFMATLTGDRGGIIKVEDKKMGGLSSWFTGSSAPVSVGIPITEQESLPPKMISGEASDRTKLLKRPTLQAIDSSSSNTTPTKTPSSTTSRFNFFSTPKSAPKTIQLPTCILQSDELLTLSISSALFPSGPPSPSDTFSPSAYKNLQMNAEGTLSKLQTAYKLQTLSLHELNAEHAVLAEELEEAETRAQCFKSQLEDMAHRVTQQDKAMEELVSELAREKQARAEEKDAREKSITLVKSDRERVQVKHSSCCSGIHPEEDLEVDYSLVRNKKPSWRRSVGELSETDTESTDSVFSRCISPTTESASETASTMTIETTPELHQASFGRVVSLPNPLAGSQLKPKSIQRQSTFQKILLGRETEGREKDNRGLGLEDGCKNCMGRESSVAWDTVGLLRAENKGLKERVGELEGAVEGALDLCVGLRL